MIKKCLNCLLKHHGSSGTVLSLIEFFYHNKITVAVSLYSFPRFSILQFNVIIDFRGSGQLRNGVNLFTWKFFFEGDNQIIRQFFFRIITKGTLKTAILIIMNS